MGLALKPGHLPSSSNISLVVAVIFLKKVPSWVMVLKKWHCFGIFDIHFSQEWVGYGLDFCLSRADTPPKKRDWRERQKPFEDDQTVEEFAAGYQVLALIPLATSD